MSSPEQNAELVERFLVMLRDEGLVALGSHLEHFLHPEVEWTPGLVSMGRTTYQGIEAYREYNLKAASQTGGKMTIQEVRPVGEDRVLGLAWIDYRSKDERFYSEWALAMRIEDGKIREMRSFVSHAKAARAVEEMGAQAQGSPNA
jgi:ketosteroid isomerase-like protein